MSAVNDDYLWTASAVSRNFTQYSYSPLVITDTTTTTTYGGWDNESTGGRWLTIKDRPPTVSVCPKCNKTQEKYAKTFFLDGVRYCHDCAKEIITKELLPLVDEQELMSKDEEL